MHLDSLDLKSLRLLDAILSEGSVSKAAARIGLSQSAASHALARLRDRLGDPLLVRSAEGMSLTPRARELQEPLHRALEALERAVAPPAAFAPATERRTFHLIAADYAQCILLPPLLEQLEHEAPGIGLSVLPFTDHIERQLSQGLGDLALVVQYDKVPGLRVQAILRERLVCVVRRDHSEIRDTLSLEDFLRLQHVLVAPRGRRGSTVDSLLSERGQSRRIRVSVPSFLAAPYLVARTDLLVTLADRLARQLAEWLPLRLFEPPLPLPGFTLSMLWDARLENDPGHRWLRALIRRIARQA
ncbi:LysR family transcriptional regulator [Hyalangium gracile]|uniref:LysR family transcriptional regulator n=1 Tax=Hyalangium gracile TaxID=394092 RepID=UPI001CCE8350|nr:LysR family transcriptional regulator [Hyalangium gracile]